MAIIYSYSKTSEVYGSDLLVLSRFHDSVHVDNGRNYSLDIGTLGSYIRNNYSNTLDQVLIAGNNSLEDAKVNRIFLWNNQSGVNYGCFLEGSKNRVNFHRNDETYLGSFSYKEIRVSTGSFEYNVSFPTISSAKTATFQDKSGTIAYLSDVDSRGLAAQISESNVIINTTTESSLIGNIVGTLSVPANTFSVGDSFDASIIGKISCLSSATVRIRIKTDYGALLVDTGAIDLSTATEKTFGLNVEFTIREIGAAGIAYIISGGSFSYNRDGSNSPEVVMFNSKNNTTFDTTTLNSLEVTAEWNNASTSNSIYSDIFTLNKIF